MSQVAALVDPAMVQVDNLEYGAPLCVAFQRVSVLVSELLLLYAIIEWVKSRQKFYVGSLKQFGPNLNVALLFVQFFHIYVHNKFK